MTVEGVINMDDGEKQTVMLDVMPLINGYLPLPLVRLSKYIPADVKLSSNRGEWGRKPVWWVSAAAIWSKW